VSGACIIPLGESSGIDFARLLAQPGRVQLHSHNAAHVWVVWVLTFAVTTLGAGCRSRVEQTIKDTEGRSFIARCAADRTCALTQQSGPVARSGVVEPGQATAAKSALKFRATGRVVGVCAVQSVGVEPTALDCRPIQCERDNDCPLADGLTTGVCISRLCTEPSHAINSDDAVMLCLAGTGVGPRDALQTERLALGLNCGHPCRIPKPCRQF
jgi:hypothetical protein